MVIHHAQWFMQHLSDLEPALGALTPDEADELLVLLVQSVLKGRLDRLELSVE